jgi:hypothetical protein
LPQQWKLRAQFVQHGHKPGTRSAICRFDLSDCAKCFHDQIDRAIVKMQPAAVGQQSNLSA